MKGKKGAYAESVLEQFDAVLDILETFERRYGWTAARAFLEQYMEDTIGDAFSMPAKQLEELEKEVNSTMMDKVVHKVRDATDEGLAQIRTAMTDARPPTLPTYRTHEHSADVAPSGLDRLRGPTDPALLERERREGRCHSCKMIGHMSHDCPNTLCSEPGCGLTRAACDNNAHSYRRSNPTRQVAFEEPSELKIYRQKVKKLEKALKKAKKASAPVDAAGAEDAAAEDSA